MLERILGNMVEGLEFSSTGQCHRPEKGRLSRGEWRGRGWVHAERVGKEGTRKKNRGEEGRGEKGGGGADPLRGFNTDGFSRLQ